MSRTEVNVERVKQIVRGDHRLTRVGLAIRNAAVFHMGADVDTAAGSQFVGDLPNSPGRVDIAGHGPLVTGGLAHDGSSETLDVPSQAELGDGESDTLRRDTELAGNFRR